MTPEIRRCIHAFRNALVLAADTRSHECFQMGRWQELNAFPHGCCDLASNFLAQYLQDTNPDLKPVVLHIQATEQFREDHNSTIHSHVVVEVAGWYIDLTLNQFSEHTNRVIIDDRTGTVGTLLRHIRYCGGETEERGIQLDTQKENGHDLYAWLRDTANSLLAASGPATAANQ